MTKAPRPPGGGPKRAAAGPPARAVPKTAAIDEVARLTADLKSESARDLDRVRELLVVVAATQPDQVSKAVPGRRSGFAIDEALHAAISEVKPAARDLRSPPLHAIRRDVREDLLEVRLADSLTA